MSQDIKQKIKSNLDSLLDIVKNAEILFGARLSRFNWTEFGWTEGRETLCLGFDGHGYWDTDVLLLARNPDSTFSLYFRNFQDSIIIPTDEQDQEKLQEIWTLLNQEIAHRNSSKIRDNYLSVKKFLQDKTTIVHEIQEQITVNTELPNTEKLSLSR
jgi:hypothetical protein